MVKYRVTIFPNSSQTRILVFHLAISATSKFKLFASSDTEGCIKIWDNTNSLLREIYLDKTLCAIEFLPSNGELLIAYQNNIHLILPENYLLNSKNIQLKQQMISETIAEDNRLEIIQPFYLSYQSLPIFNYHIKTHHSKKRLQRFERQLAGKENDLILHRMYILRSLCCHRK
jgi:hypothetical protein